jgi:hypothetical protein
MAARYPIDSGDDAAAETTRRWEEIQRRRSGTGPHRGPRDEPDRSVFRVLCFAGDVTVSDEQLRCAFPSFTLEEIMAARDRVMDAVAQERLKPDPVTLDEMADEPSVSLDEVRAAGLDPRSTSGWAGLMLRTPEELAAFFGDACAPST